MVHPETSQETPPLPPGQQLVAPGKWPVIGERQPSETATPWSLTIDGLVDRPTTWTLPQLRQLPATRCIIDIHCVTRWSKLGAEFSGLWLSDLLQLVQPRPEARFLSFQARSSQQHSTSLRLEDALAQNTLIALDYEGQPLEIGHGGPIRNIVPGRYFYKSVKWLERIELLEVDRLGTWEAGSGYHNQADPWLEQRYMAPTLDKRQAAALLESRDFSRRDLRSIDASDRQLQGLQAAGALLRDANFQGAQLQDADFSGANLSNAHFRGADLRGARFVKADVEGADFSGADLRGADFQGASLIGASFVSRQEGRAWEARLDASTQLPPDVQQPLFPEQLAFVQQHLANPPAL